MSDKDAFVRLIEFADTCTRLPEVRQWDGHLSPADIFICAIGFEDRAPVIATRLAGLWEASTGNSERQALLCEYSTNYEDNRRNKDEVEQSVHKFCSQVETVSAERPEAIRRAVLSALIGGSRERKVRVAFDISAASGALILSVLRALIEAKECVDLQVLYCEPRDYFPQRELWDVNPERLIEEAVASGDETSVAEYGVADVEINELYPGVSVESRPEFVIAVPAFRTHRLVRCLAHLSDQPLASPAENIFWILGEPPAGELKWRRNLQERIVNYQMAQFVGMSTSDALAPRLGDNQTVCSTRDYREILKIVLEQVDAHAGSNLSLVHMGSKLQGVGVALALSVRAEVTVCGSRPIQFNPSKYSQGIGTLWHLNLAQLDQIVSGIGRIGTLCLETKLETSRDRRPSI